MAIFKNIIRGGQTNIHQFRMLRQILWIGLIFSVLGSGFYGVDLSLKRIPGWAWSQWIDLKKADCWVAVLSKERAAKVFQDVEMRYGVVKNVSILSIVRDPHLRDTERRIIHELGIIFDLCWKLLLKIYLSILLLWYMKGYLTRKSKHLRGSSLVSSFKLKWMIKLKWKGASFNIDGIPLIKNKETSHMLITGTTGSGKSNCLHKLIPQIRKKGQKAVIVDMSGDFLEKHYDPEKDIILNPFDQRSALWSPWADCLNQTHYDAYAAAMIPTVFKSDPFWDNAARAILSTALEKLKEEGRDKVSELCNLLLSQRTRDIEKYFSGTRVTNLISNDSEKTTGSILANLGTHLKSLVYIEDTATPFSIREWVRGEEGTQNVKNPEMKENIQTLSNTVEGASSAKDLDSKVNIGEHFSNPPGSVFDPSLGSRFDGPSDTHFEKTGEIVSPQKIESFPYRTKTKKASGFLFITASPDMRETLRPLMTAWMDIVLSGLMSLPMDRKRRVWMIMDELPALHKVPSLSMALAESRKYGGCIIAGIQSIAQLEDIYGANQAMSLLDNFNTKMFFRAMNPDTARWISRVLGSYEQEEVNENLSYGANTMRDGVNLSHQLKTHQLVTEGEVMALKDLEAYIKLPENYPISKLKMSIEKLRSQNTPFLLKDIKTHSLLTEGLIENAQEDGRTGASIPEKAENKRTENNKTEDDTKESNTKKDWSSKDHPTLNVGEEISNPEKMITQSLEKTPTKVPDEKQKQEISSKTTSDLDHSLTPTSSPSLRPMLNSTLEEDSPNSKEYEDQKKSFFARTAQQKTSQKQGRFKRGEAKRTGIFFKS